MKALKKVLALCLAAILLLALCPAAFAEGDVTITVKNAIVGTEYKLYRLFDVVGTSTEGEITLVSYKVVAEWDNFFRNGEGKTYITLDDNGQPTLQAGATEKALATAIQTYLVSSSPSCATITADSNTVAFTVPKGYFFLSSSAGNNCILNTAYADSGIEVTEKNSVIPISDKKIKEGDQKVESNYAGIGETVTYEATITLGNNATGYVYHDQMSSGLTFNASSLRVTVDGTALAPDSYTLTTGGSEVADPKCTFEISFTDTCISALAGGNVITISYSATVNKDAYDADKETNTGWVHYNNDDTAKMTTDTSPLEFTLVKTNEDGTKNLSGAKFQLLDSENKALSFVKVERKGYRPAVDTDEESVKVTELETPEDGRIKFYGLKAGTYALKETEAPKGYNLLTQDVGVTIASTGAVSIAVNDINASAENKTITVKNKAGTTLPSTGGMGTTVFYVVGGLLMAAAAVLLITKKRMGKNA